MQALALLLVVTHASFAFGRTGGNIMPFTVTIAPGGAITRTGPAPGTRARLTRQQLAGLERTAAAVHFTTLPRATSCPGTLPDVAAQFVRVGSRTVRAHGGCVARFQRLWQALANATG